MKRDDIILKPMMNIIVAFKFCKCWDASVIL